MNTVDLHVHSNKSDGTMSPTELVCYGLTKGLSAFALTDHDTISGISEAVSASVNTGLEVIPGIELSTEYNGRDIHIVGLYIPYQDPLFQKNLKEFQDSREQRNKKMCLRLTEAGIPVSLKQLKELYPSSILTRAHYANFLLNQGYVHSREEAFERYIGDHAPCFVPREKITPAQAVTFLHNHKAISILAHPILYHMSDGRLDQLVSELAEYGLNGLEAIYSTYSSSEERDMRKLAGKHHLLISGGSDFHGTNKNGIDLATGIGKLFIPEDILLQIKELKHDLFT